MAAERRSKQEWRAILDRFESSGQTAQQFCVDNGFNAAYFSKQRVRLRQSAFVAVQAPAPKALVSAPAAVTVEVGRYTVRCGTDAPAGWIADLLTRLRR